MRDELGEGEQGGVVQGTSEGVRNWWPTWRSQNVRILQVGGALRYYTRPLLALSPSPSHSTAVLVTNILTPFTPFLTT